LKNSEILKKIEELKAKGDYLSTIEAAEYLKIRLPSLYAAVFVRRLKGIKIAHYSFFLRKNLDEYKLSKFNRDNIRYEGELLFDLEKGRYSVLQVAKILSEELKRPVPITHVYDWLWKGQLKGRRIGSRWVILKEDLESYTRNENSTFSFKLERYA